MRAAQFRARRATPWGGMICVVACLLASCSTGGYGGVEPIYLERGDRISVRGNELRRYVCAGQLAFICQAAPGRFSTRDCVCQ